MDFQLPDPVIPDHVPADLVRPFPYMFGTTTAADPFGEWAPAVHQGPPIFYAPHAYPGATPAWIVRRVEDLRHTGLALPSALGLAGSALSAWCWHRTRVHPAWQTLDEQWHADATWLLGRPESNR